MNTAPKISLWFSQISNGWVALVGVVIFILFSALVLPRQAAQAEARNSEAGTPDLSLFYTAQDLYEMAEAYGEAGRAAHIQTRFTFDVAWPLVYTFFLVTTISWLFTRAFRPASRWQWANLAPVVAMLFDFSENVATSWVMSRYPDAAWLAAGLAPFFTAAKWAWVGTSFGLLLVGLGATFWRAVRCPGSKPF